MTRTLRDFWVFLIGETVSNLGSSFTLFALPLLVFQLTGSPVGLALSMAVTYLPYLLFGLVIGALVDRWDRKRLMILTDLGSALVIGSIPALAALGMLAHRDFFLVWVYGVGFVSTTLKIFFETSQLAAIPSLVGKEALVTANGRVDASFSAAQTVGPLLAGALLFVLPLSVLFLVDAASFLISASALAVIRTHFNPTTRPEKKLVLQDIREGLRYVWRQPVLRAISTMTPLMNVITTTTTAQLVLFATVAYQATGQQVSVLYAAGSLGIVLFSLLAAPLRSRWPFSKVMLGALVLMGSLLVVLGFTPWYWLAIPIWGLSQGVETVFNINAKSLRQAVVPNHLLGRVMSVAYVLAYSSIPIGALGGGAVIAWIGSAQIARIFSAIGLLVILGALVVSLTALGHAERYLPESQVAVSRPSLAHWKPAIRELAAGMWATVPLALPIIPYMALYGVIALAAGLSKLSVLALSLLVFSGAILPAVQALAGGAPLLVVGGMIAVLNLRQMLYSAKLAPRLVGLRLPWRLLVSYCLTDESFGVIDRRAAERGWDWRCWPFFIGSGLMMWIAAQGATLLGLSVGAQLPTNLALDFLPTLAFLCFMVLSLKGVATVLAALAAGGAAVGFAGLPLRLGTLVAILIGITVGMLTQRVRQPHALAWSKEGKAWQSGS
jgi:predicted branched-subunit amino acid permease